MICCREKGDRGQPLTLRNTRSCVSASWGPFVLPLGKPHLVPSAFHSQTYYVLHKSYHPPTQVADLERRVSEVLRGAEDSRAATDALLLPVRRLLASGRLAMNLRASLNRLVLQGDAYMMQHRNLQVGGGEGT